MDESRIGQYSISVTTYPIMALVILINTQLLAHFSKKMHHSVKSSFLRFEIAINTSGNTFDEKSSQGFDSHT